MTNFIKRNIGLAVFLVISLIVVIILLLMVKQQTSLASALEAQVEEQVKFFENLKREKVAVIEENLETAKKNQEAAEDRLSQLRTTLVSRSGIAVPNYTGVETKNLLREQTQAMLEELYARGVEVPSVVRRFSFGDVLDRDALPDEETEVPTLVKQLQLVEEIVQLAATSLGAGAATKAEFSDIKRLSGTGIIEGNDYHIIPFSVTVTGELANVKRFVTRLQSDSDYFFLVHHFNMETLDTVQGAVAARPAAVAAGGRPGERRFEPPDDMRAFQDPRRTRTQPPENVTPEEPEQEGMSKEERRVNLSEMVTATVRFDFVEFIVPQQEI